MKRVLFVTPEGKDIENPSLEFLKKVFFNKETDYWKHDAGDGGLIFEEDSFYSEIILVRSENYGFLVRYVGQDESDDFSLIYNHPQKKNIKVYPGGNEWILPNKYFVPSEVAWIAIKEFVLSGKKTEILEWEFFNPPNI